MPEQPGVGYGDTRVYWHRGRPRIKTEYTKYIVTDEVQYMLRMWQEFHNTQDISDMMRDEPPFELPGEYPDELTQLLEGNAGTVYVGESDHIGDDGEWYSPPKKKRGEK